jgi:hypothetical protein
MDPLIVFTRTSLPKNEKYLSVKAVKLVAMSEKHVPDVWIPADIIGSWLSAIYQLSVFQSPYDVPSEKSRIHMYTSNCANVGEEYVGDSISTYPSAPPEPNGSSVTFVPYIQPGQFSLDAVDIVDRVMLQENDLSLNSFPVS